MMIKNNSEDYTNNNPVVIFAYNRPWHLMRVISSLLENIESSQTDIYIYCDGAKNEKDQLAVSEVHEYVDSISGFKSITTFKQNINRGLAQSIITGVSSLLQQHDKVIILEDDLVVSPFFLEYMNKALNLYEQDEQVASVHAYSYPVKSMLPDTFFIRGADCWGWGTWSRAWDKLELDGKKMFCALNKTKQLYSFDMDGCYPFSLMLYRQVVEQNNSWAILWHASTYLKGMLTLNPGRSLVHNIGNDDSGTHSSTTKMFDVEIRNYRIKELRRITIKEDRNARETIKSFYLANQCTRTLLKKLRLNSLIYSFMVLRLCFK